MAASIYNEVKVSLWRFCLKEDRSCLVCFCEFNALTQSVRDIGGVDYFCYAVNQLQTLLYAA
jgi:hypothetical protein